MVYIFFCYLVTRSRMKDYTVNYLIKWGSVRTSFFSLRAYWLNTTSPTAGSWTRKESLYSFSCRVKLIHQIKRVVLSSHTNDQSHSEGNLSLVTWNLPFPVLVMIPRLSGCSLHLITPPGRQRGIIILLIKWIKIHWFGHLRISWHQKVPTGVTWVKFGSPGSQINQVWFDF
jgi:hypothetical protein